MEDPGLFGNAPLLWVLLIGVAFIMVIMWGALFFVLSVGTWVIARTRLRDEDPRRSRDDRDYRL